MFTAIKPLQGVGDREGRDPKSTHEGVLLGGNSLAGSASVSIKKSLDIVEEGYIALTTVLVLMAVLLSTIVSITYTSVGEAQSGLALFKGEENLGFGEGCVEDVMLKIRSDSSYSGTSFTRPEGTCSIIYNPGGAGPTSWDITVTSQSTQYQRKVRVIFTRNPTGITLTSWKEI